MTENLFLITNEASTIEAIETSIALHFLTALLLLTRDPQMH